MKEIKLVKNVKYEHFPTDFRVAVLFTVYSEEKSEFNNISASLEPLGYKKINDNSFQYGSTVLSFDGNGICIMFDPELTNSNERTTFITELFSRLSVPFLINKSTLISIHTLNRYVLDTNELSDRNKGKAINFFFKNIDGEDSAISINKNIISKVDISFDGGGENKVVLQYIVSSSILLNKKSKITSAKISSIFKELTNTNFKMWRNVVSKNVLNVMRREGNEQY